MDSPALTKKIHVIISQNKYLYIIHTLTSSEFINFPSYCHLIFFFIYIEACITVSIKKAEAIVGKILLLLLSGILCYFSLPSKLHYQLVIP